MFGQSKLKGSDLGVPRRGHSPEKFKRADDEEWLLRRAAVAIGVAPAAAAAIGRTGGGVTLNDEAYDRRQP